MSLIFKDLYFLAIFFEVLSFFLYQRTFLSVPLNMNPDKELFILVFYGFLLFTTENYCVSRSIIFS